MDKTMDDMDFSACSALVIDDSEVHRQIICSMLENVGFAQIYFASDGHEGISVTESRKPDVVICDLRMEPANGFEYLRLLRASPDPEMQQTPVIVASGLNSSGAVMKSVALESSAFIAKPFRRRALTEALKRILH